MTFDVTCNHHRKKKGKNTTRTIPFLVREVQGLSGFALANADPEKGKINDRVHLSFFNFLREKISTFEEQKTMSNFILYYTVRNGQFWVVHRV